ncbi:hypothetical protein GCM10023320_49830 [Pseudonocardia adelaidensis]|uniref:Uncharacterized protein n=1 Tax=Pseudonocardia adelaidensis TaxID=648754 RepID=A0ABP9NNZ9_9PSEU
MTAGSVISPWKRSLAISSPTWARWWTSKSIGAPSGVNAITEGSTGCMVRDKPTAMGSPIAASPLTAAPASPA